MYIVDAGQVKLSNNASGATSPHLRIVHGTESEAAPTRTLIQELKQDRIILTAKNFGIRHGYLAINNQGAWVILAKGFANPGNEPITFKVADVATNDLNRQDPQRMFSTFDKLFSLEPGTLVIDKVFVEADPEDIVDGTFITTRLVNHNDSAQKACDTSFNYYLPGLSRNYLQDPTAAEEPEPSRIVFHTQQIMRGDQEFMQQTFSPRD